MDIICGWVIANCFLKKSFSDKIYITQLKLNCLIYILYSDFLYKTGKGLFNEPFIKTQRGPVLPSIEFKFGCFENKKIKKYAKDAKGNINVVSGELFEKMMDCVWNRYKNMSDKEILSLINDKEFFQKKEIEQPLFDTEILSDEIKSNQTMLQNANSSMKKLLNMRHN